MWYSPELSGCRPPPCAAFSFTRIDRHRVVLFGGRQQKERVNEIYILDMNEWVRFVTEEHCVLVCGHQIAYIQ